MTDSEDVRKLSRETLWSGGRTWDMIDHGSLLRIADAAEAMAKNYNDLLRDRDYYKNRTEDEERQNLHLRRSNAALKGVITRLERREERVRRA